MTTTPTTFNARRFRSTAMSYARYRVPYPDPLIAAVAERVGLRKGDRVLDLGCGPAMLAIGLARLGMSAVAMDPEPEMLEAAQVAAAEAAVSIEIVRGSSYDLGPGLGTFRLVTMGRSFHWMDRVATLTALDATISGGGAIALFYDRTVLRDPNWEPLIAYLSRKYAPGGRGVREMRKDPKWRPQEAVIVESAFAEIETIGRLVVENLSADDVMGRVFSMSVTSPATLGDNYRPFEAELRAELSLMAPNGRFRSLSMVEALLAFRRGETPS